MAAILAVCAAAAGASAQDIKIGVNYVCNGERILIDSCNIRDTSDTSKCMVGHPETTLPNGLMKYTWETRGDLKKLLPTCKQPSADEVKREDAFRKKIQDQQDAAIKKATAPAPQVSASPGGGGAGGTGAGALAGSQDPQTRQMRRCVTAGRLPAACLGNGLMGSLMGGVNELLSSVAPGVVGKEVTGPQMAGMFLGNGQWRLEFSENSVAVSCADMRPDSHAYTIAMVNGRAVLTIAATPKDIVLAVNGETLSGPGAVVVDGIVSLGVHAGYDYTTGKQADIYEYQHVRRNCVRPELTSKGAGPGIVEGEKKILEGIFSDGETGPPTPPGLRMNGTYAAPSGFSVQFFPESVILGCGPDVARAYPYTVIADGRQVAVKVAAPNHPLSLAFGANNTLDPGSGAYLVEGRRLTGQNANGDYTFAPMNATCNLAVLAPGPVPGGMVPVSSGAPTATAGAPPAAGGPAAAAPAGAAVPPVAAKLSTPEAPTGNAVLMVISGLAGGPGAPNALAGHPYILLRDQFDKVVAKSGAAMAPGTSGVKTMVNACRNRAPDCQKISDSVKNESASAVRADAAGKGVLPGVPPGTYYLMISGVFNNQPLFWGFAVNLKPGQNSVTLDQHNATPVN